MINIHDINRVLFFFLLGINFNTEVTALGPQQFNSLSAEHIYQQTMPSLVPTMPGTYWLLSHDLNQCWLIVNWARGNKYDIYIKIKQFCHKKFIVCKMPAILFRPQQLSVFKPVDWTACLRWWQSLSNGNVVILTKFSSLALVILTTSAPIDENFTKMTILPFWIVTESYMTSRMTSFIHVGISADG